MAGFRSLAAVGRSIENVLNAAFAAEQPVTGQNTSAVLVRTNDLDLGVGTLIVPPALSILLYRADFNKTTRAGWSAVGSVDGRSHLPLDLHYLLTAWADNADHEHQIIGRTMQTLEGLGALSGPLLHPMGDWDPNEAAQLYLEDISTHDLMRTFDSLTTDFRLTVPYIARIVVLTGSSEGAAADVTALVTGLRPPPGAGL